MNLIKKLFHRPNRYPMSRFERYYGEIVRSGAGYPTADEARRDLRKHQSDHMPFGWPL